MRELAREIDAAIAGFMRGQTLVCLILGTLYAIGLSLIGLNSGLLIGLDDRTCQLHSLCRIDYRLLVAFGVAVAQFWPQLARRLLLCSRCSLSARFSKAMCCRRIWSARASDCIRSG